VCDATLASNVALLIFKSDNEMRYTQTHNHHESDRHGAVDVVTPWVPNPDANTVGACSSQPGAPQPEALSGSGGEFSGAGASDGWADCVEAVTDGVSSAAEGAGSLLVDAVAGFISF
jgi:hypothetical protein